MDNNLKEILEYVYFGSIVKHRPNQSSLNVLIALKQVRRLIWVFAAFTCPKAYFLEYVAFFFVFFFFFFFSFFFFFIQRTSIMCVNASLMDTNENYPLSFTKRDNFFVFLSVFLHTNTFVKRGFYSIRKGFSPSGDKQLWQTYLPWKCAYTTYFFLKWS